MRKAEGVGGNLIARDRAPDPTTISTAANVFRSNTGTRTTWWTTGVGTT
jgi:hypothetical protein